MSKQPSILSYFSKSPKVIGSSSATASSTPCTPISGRGKALAERQNHSSTTTTPVNSSRKRRAEWNRDKDADKGEPNPCPFEEFDLVWAKLDGYPFWPAIVCRHPTLSSISRTAKQSQAQIHVQFFDDPPQRSWTRSSDCIAFQDKRHPKLTKISDTKLEQAIEWAMDALPVEKSKRAQFIVDLLPSDNEEEPADENDRSIRNSNSKRRRIVKSDDEDDDKKAAEHKKKPKVVNVEMEDLDDDEPDDHFDSGSDASGDEYVPDKEDKQVSSSSESELDEDAEEDDPMSDRELDEDDQLAEEETPLANKRSVKGRTKGRQSAQNRSVNTKPAKPSKSNGNTSFQSFNMSAANLSNDDDDDFGATNKHDNEQWKQVQQATVARENTQWPHLTFDFLQPNKIRDLQNRRPDHPDYDSSTLYVPQDFIKQQTPAHKQWWQLKSQHFDKLIFFKMGKFYELFHMDAVTICSETNVVYMRGDYAHAGFPENAFNRYARKLIDRNYKCVRIEQMETPQARDERCKGLKAKDKVVSRSICRITTKGTRTLNTQDGDIENAHSSFLLALTEKVRFHILF
jgi:DNA mismatch repair protein MSH6